MLPGQCLDAAGLLALYTNATGSDDNGANDGT